MKICVSKALAEGVGVKDQNLGVKVLNYSFPSILYDFRPIMNLTGTVNLNHRLSRASKLAFPSMSRSYCPADNGDLYAKTYSFSQQYCFVYLSVTTKINPS